MMQHGLHGPLLTFDFMQHTGKFCQQSLIIKQQALIAYVQHSLAAPLHAEQLSARYATHAAI
jgi:hypothetical protein